MQTEKPRCPCCGRYVRPCVCGGESADLFSYRLTPVRADRIDGQVRRLFAGAGKMGAWIGAAIKMEVAE